MISKADGKSPGTPSPAKPDAPLLDQILARMLISESFRGDSMAVVNRLSTTHYVGGKGDEMADWAHNYKLFGDGQGETSLLNTSPSTRDA